MMLAEVSGPNIKPLRLEWGVIKIVYDIGRFRIKQTSPTLE